MTGSIIPLVDISCARATMCLEYEDIEDEFENRVDDPFKVWIETSIRGGCTDLELFAQIDFMEGYFTRENIWYYSILESLEAHKRKYPRCYFYITLCTRMMEADEVDAERLLERLAH